MKHFHFFHWLKTAVVCAAAVAAPVWAAYPDKPVKLVVTYAPGGAIDILGRLIAKELSSMWGQPVFIENMPGANGAIAMQAVARAPADGYTLVLASSATTTMNAALQKLPFDVLKDFTPVVNLIDGPHAIAINAKLPVQDLQEFIKLAREASPGMSYASPGIGNGGHFAMEMLKQEAHFDLMHVAYKGAAPALNDLIAGHVQAYFASAAALLPHVKAGAIKVLAVTSKDRLPQIPNVPTMAQAGFPNFELPVFGGLMGPAGMPTAIVQKINTDANKVLQSPAFRESLKEKALLPTGGTSQEFVQFLAADLERWKRVVRDGNIKAE